MTIGERLRCWRVAAGLSQAEAGKRLGTAQRTWAAWELDESTPEVDYCDAIERLTDGEIRTCDWARARRKKRLDDAAAAEESGPLPNDDDSHAKSA